MTPAKANRRFIDLLGVRLGLALGLALLPVGLIAGMQSADLIAKARDHSEAALAGETLRALRPQMAAIKQAQGAAGAIAALRPAADGSCNSLLARLVETGSYASAGLYGTDGAVRCATPGAAAGLAPSAAFARAVMEGMPSLAAGLAEGQALTVLYPQADGGGTVTGVAAVGLQEIPIDIKRDGFALFLFDPAGMVLSSSLPADQTAQLLPEGQGLIELAEAGAGSGTFSATSAAGEDRAYSVVQVGDGEILALGTWPQDVAGLSFWQSLPPLILPALMWAVSLIAAWLAAEKLVTRHIRRLRVAILDFADGSRSIRPLPMQTAPQEIRDTAEAFARMTTTILRDEAELEDALHGKEILLREVHHRVKNNLQLIASIVNMQIRRTRSEEARRIMRSLQERMLSLATIHNGLYQTADVSEIRVEKLFPGIVDQIVRGATAQGRSVRLTTAFDSFALPLDQAVPLALLMTEALSNGLRFASTRTGEVPALSITLRAGEEGQAMLEVVNDAGGAAAIAGELGEESTGIGTQLLRGFTRQLGGTFHREFTGGLCRVTVWFTPGTKATKTG